MPQETIRIGGQQYSWNSTLSRVDGLPRRGLTSVDWTQKLDVETIYAQTQDGVPIGDTAGQYSCAISGKWLWEYLEQLKDYLTNLAPGDPPGTGAANGQSYGQTKFKYQLQASEPLDPGAQPIMLTASNCRLIEEKGAAAKGQAGLEVDFTLWARTLEINGRTMFTVPIPTF